MALSEDNAWISCDEKGRELDKRMIDELETSMSTLLLFAGLFSAVVTSLVTQTLSLLQQSSQDVSRDILIAISLQLANSSLPAYTEQAFVTPAWVVRVNFLFCLSLGVSLVTAFAAVLVLQWLHDYDYGTNQLASITDRVLNRHFRFLGRRRWRLEEFASLLPVLLHIALLLFFAGFVEWLLQANKTVAATMAACLAISGIMYLLTSTIPTFDVSAPFRSPLSRFICRTSTQITRIWRKLEMLMASINSQDLSHLHTHYDKDTSDIEVIEKRVIARQTVKLKFSALSWLASTTSPESSSVPTFLDVICALRSLSAEDPELFSPSSAPWSEICETICASFSDHKTFDSYSPYDLEVGSLMIQLLAIFGSWPLGPNVCHLLDTIYVIKRTQRIDENAPRLLIKFTSFKRSDPELKLSDINISQLGDCQFPDVFTRGLFLRIQRLTSKTDSFTPNHVLLLNQVVLYVGCGISRKKFDVLHFDPSMGSRELREEYGLTILEPLVLKEALRLVYLLIFSGKSHQITTPETLLDELRMLFSPHPDFIATYHQHGLLEGLFWELYSAVWLQLRLRLYKAITLGDVHEVFTLLNVLALNPPWKFGFSERTAYYIGTGLENQSNSGASIKTLIIKFHVSQVLRDTIWYKFDSKPEDRSKLRLRITLVGAWLQSTLPPEIELWATDVSQTKVLTPRWIRWFWDGMIKCADDEELFRSVLSQLLDLADLFAAYASELETILSISDNPELPLTFLWVLLITRMDQAVRNKVLPSSSLAVETWDSPLCLQLLRATMSNYLPDYDFSPLEIELEIIDRALRHADSIELTLEFLASFYRPEKIDHILQKYFESSARPLKSLLSGRQAAVWRMLDHLAPVAWFLNIFIRDGGIDWCLRSACLSYHEFSQKDTPESVSETPEVPLSKRPLQGTHTGLSSPSDGESWTDDESDSDPIIPTNFVDHAISVPDQSGYNVESPLQNEPKNLFKLDRQERRYLEYIMNILDMKLKEYNGEGIEVELKLSKLLTSRNSCIYPRITQTKYDEFIKLLQEGLDRIQPTSVFSISAFSDVWLSGNVKLPDQFSGLDTDLPENIKNVTSDDHNGWLYWQQIMREVLSLSNQPSPLPIHGSFMCSYPI